jgi:hypothetical protein
MVANEDREFVLHCEMQSGLTDHERERTWVKGMHNQIPEFP